MGKHKKKRKKTRRDTAEIARSVVEQAVGEKLDGEPLNQEQPDCRDPKAVKRGKKGAASRHKKLTPEQRSAIATQAANSRWHNKDD